MECSGEFEEFNDCPEANGECEASCDWTRFPETIPPNCSSGACGVARCTCKEGYVKKATDEHRCVPFSFCTELLEQQQCPENSTWGKCGKFNNGN
jgi:hypothetical protein